MPTNTKYYQGKYTPKNPSKYKGDPTNVIYRSSWELKFMVWCDNHSQVVEWASEETVIPYICPTDNRPHRYFVDFKIRVKEKDGSLQTYLVEIKPDKQTRPPIPPKRKTKAFITEVMTWGKNEAKWKAAEQYCKDRNYKFIILTEFTLGIKPQPGGRTKSFSMETVTKSTKSG